jgi:hypothetical protein
VANRAYFKDFVNFEGMIVKKLPMEWNIQLKGKQFIIRRRLTPPF